MKYGVYIHRIMRAGRKEIEEKDGNSMFEGCTEYGVLCSDITT